MPTEHTTPLSFLFSLERLGMKFGLESMRTICAALGDPQRSFRSIIVAGTNGKGSVTAMTSAALHAAGHRVARYTSPHLERLEERFVIGEREVGAGVLEEATRTVQETVERLVRDGTLERLPTFFECATAIGFELFRSAAVELAVVEVGLGGRLDATNVITPIAAVITSIDFDHQELLGGTLDAIAREKAGVIKPGIPVIVGEVPSEADRVIRDICRERDARFISAPEAVRVAARIADGETRVTLESATRRLENVRLALSGRHQSRNAAVALCLLEELAENGIAIDVDAIRAGLTDARWHGRLERFTYHGADVLLDAAHNPAGARALASHLREIGWMPPHTRLTLVFGAMGDKDVAGMLAELLPLAATVICATAPNPRALAADELAAIARAVPGAPADVRSVADPATALDAACAAGAHVVAAGSMFLIGPLRGILR